MRATRFRLQMPVHYRPPGSPGWSGGVTVNISRSGLLFIAGAPMAVGEKIEVSFALPQAGSPARVLCRGRVVRIADTGETGAPGPAIAATISRYRITPSGGRRRGGAV